ncbi:MAG: hypothetical protein HYZ75_15855 [Elusimicrobia bacterium]|nr:hypothetical protein [Elusimicrobiota bacterium]
MESGLDSAAFERELDALLTETARAAPRTRVFGELGDILARRGDLFFCERLETLWSARLDDPRIGGVLHAYRLDVFSPADIGAPLAAVRRHHDEVSIGLDPARLLKAFEQALTLEVGGARKGEAPTWLALLTRLGSELPKEAVRVTARARVLYEKSLK